MKSFILLTILFILLLVFLPTSSSPPPPPPPPSVPEPYYTCEPDPSLTFEDLNRTIHEIRMPHPYEKNVFDCSEMSAYTEWYLENHGFRADIVVNRFPTGPHAYVIAYVDGGVYPIETTTEPLHFYTNSSYCLYIHYKKRFETIYDAVDYAGIGEWDWWSFVSGQFP